MTSLIIACAALGCVALIWAGNLLRHYLRLRSARTREKKQWQDKAICLIAGIYAQHGGYRDVSKTAVHWINADKLTVQPDGGERFRMVIWPGVAPFKSGVTYSPRAVNVCWPSYALRFSDTVLAHELLHCAQAKKCIVDPAHKSDDWALVERANDALVRMGL